MRYIYFSAVISVFLTCSSVKKSQAGTPVKSDARSAAASSKDAKAMYLLGSFRLSQNFSIVADQLGKPDKIHTFPDKFEAHIYQFKGFQLIFEKNPMNPKHIYAIQLTGKESPEETCLGKVCLSSSKEDVLKYLGTPSEIRDAVDEVTKEKVESTQYYAYKNPGNFSIEIKDGKVASIKITDSVTPVPKDPNVYGFIQAVKNRDYYGMAEHLDPMFEGRIDKKPVPLKKSMMKFLKDKNEMTNLLFGSEHGFSNLTMSDQQFEGLRLFQEGGQGRIFKFKSAKGRTIEIVYRLSHQGWNIWEINLI